MMKFKVYRAISFITLLLSILIIFLPMSSFTQSINSYAIVTMIAGLLFIACYAFLASIFNFYREPVWKKISIWFFVVGIIIYNSFVVSKYADFRTGIYLLPIFYLPTIFSFATVKHKEIKPLTQSFAYVLLIVCVVRVALLFLTKSINLTAYNTAFNVLFRLPIVLMIALFHKMVNISKNNLEEEPKYEGDLL